MDHPVNITTSLIKDVIYMSRYILLICNMYAPNMKYFYIFVESDQYELRHDTKPPAPG